MIKLATCVLKYKMKASVESLHLFTGLSDYRPVSSF